MTMPTSGPRRLSLPNFPVYNTKRVRLKKGECCGLTDHGGSGPRGAVLEYDPSVGLKPVVALSFSPRTRPEEVIACLTADLKKPPQSWCYDIASPPDGPNSCSKGDGNGVPGVDGNALSTRFGFPVQVINDFGANGYAVIDGFAPRDLITLQKGRMPPGVPAWDFYNIWYGPGSGCGLGHGKGEVNQVEGSHIPVAIRNLRRQREFLDYLHARRGRRSMPTYDEILCGNGVVEMFLSFTSQKKSPIGIPVTLKHLKENSADPEVQSAKPIIITENALSNKPNRACELTVSMFMQFMGIFGQTAASLIIPRDAAGAIYIFGGIIPAMAKHRDFLLRFRAAYTDSFCDTPLTKDQQWLRSIPIYIVREPYMQSMRGAALYAAQMEV